MRAATCATVCVIVATSLRLSSALSKQSSTDHRLAPLHRKRANPDRRELLHVFDQSDSQYSNRVQNSVSNINPKGECIDNASYISKIGFTCQTIRNGGLNCDGFSVLGFSSAEVQELKTACPDACGLCTDPTSSPTSSPTETHSDVPSVAPTANPTLEPSPSPTLMPTSYPSALPTARLSSAPTSAPSHAPTFSPSAAPSSAPSRSPTQYPSAMPSSAIDPESSVSSQSSTCFDGSCADDPAYVGKINIDCEKVRSGPFDCTKFGVMSYNDVEIAELMAKCPCACNVDCTAFSAMPTFAPTHKPTTASPSATPSTTPSAAPSTTPSTTQSAAPSTTPSTTPSAAPSAAPSATPSTTPSTTPPASPPSEGPLYEVRKSNGVVDPLNHPDVSNANASPKANIVVSSIVLISAVVALFVFL